MTPRPRRTTFDAPVGRRRHGLTPGMITEMHRRQQGACLICLKPLDLTPLVDHDHALARLHGHPEEVGCPRCVRGLLCVPCNTLLGFAHDDVDVLRRAALYVEEARLAHDRRGAR